MRYLPPHYTQRDDSVCWNKDCWATVGCWMTDGATGGARQPESEWFRRKAVKPACTTGGLSDIQRGLTNMGLRSAYVHDMPRADFRRMLLARTGALIAVETAFDTYPTPQAGDFYHMLGVVAGGGESMAHKGEVRAMDPLDKRYRWIDVDAVIDVALAYNREHGEAPGTIDFLRVLPPKEGR